jgi:hypothetical protein
MALQGGQRFAVSMGDVFPHGVYALSVEQAQDYDEKSGRRSRAKDKLTGELVWTVLCIDRDESARPRDRQVTVKVSAPVQPVLPGEIAPGTGLHAVEFTDLTLTPYVSENGGRARLAYSLRSSGVYAQGKAPAGSASGRSGGLRPCRCHATPVPAPRPSRHVLQPALGRTRSSDARVSRRRTRPDPRASDTD